MAWSFIPIWLVLAVSLYLLWKVRGLLAAASTLLSLFATLATNRHVFNWLWGLDLGFTVLNEYTVLLVMLCATAMASVVDAIILLGLRRTH